MNNIYLCGFMGCGKSLTAKFISKKLKLNLIDTDIQIEKAKNMNILEIFQKHGESYFRHLETEILKDLQKVRNSVISTGGGMFANNVENAKLARSNGMIVFLETPFEICWNRIKNSNRPLILGNDINNVKRLYIKRQKIYRRVANVSIINDNSSTVCANEVVRLIQNENMF